jgi:hypothetical protein
LKVPALSQLVNAAMFAITACAFSAAGQTIGGCPVFPSDNAWNTRIDGLPVAASSGTYVNTIGASTSLHPDFSSTGYGIPYVIVPAGQPRVPVSFLYADESDPGPYPIPANAPVEGGSDQHVLVVDQGNCKLYELWDAALQSNGSWTAGSGAVFDLRSNLLRPDGFTSSDAAGLPVLPGLIRYDEVMSGQINHAIRMTVPQTRNQYIWPARHLASSLTGTQYPPMGQRFRLKASFDVSSYPFEVQVILNALKKYGAILADNGSSWYLTGAPDSRWNDSNLHTISQVIGSNLEAVDTSSLEGEANSGAVAGSPLALVGIYLDQLEVPQGGTVNAEAILTAPAPSGGAVVSIVNSTPAALSAPASVAVPAGALSVRVPTTVQPLPQTTPVVLSSVYASVTQPSAVLLVDGTSGVRAPQLSTLTLSAASVAGGTGVNGTVTLTSAAPSGGTIVALSSSNTPAASAPAAATVLAGSTSASFAVTTFALTENATADIGATLNGERLASTLTVTASSSSSATLASLSISSTTAVGGSNLTGTATLSGPAPSGGATVSLSTSNAAVATVPTNVTVPAGATSATFLVTTYSQTSNATADIGAAMNQVTKSVTVTLTPPAVSVTLTGLTLSSTTTVGGTKLTGTVTLSAAAPTAGTTVSLSSSNTSAATVPATVTVATGSTGASFTVTTYAAQSTNVSAGISATLGAVTKSVVVTITPSPDSLSALSLSANPVNGGLKVTGKVTLSAAAPASGVVVTLASSNTAVAFVPPSVTVPAGALSATFTVSTQAVSASSQVSISASLNGVIRRVGLTVNPAVLKSITAASSANGATRVKARVDLSGWAATPARIVLASSDPAAASVPPSVTIGVRAGSANFSITTHAVTASTPVTISATYAGVTKTVNLTVQP